MRKPKPMRSMTAAQFQEDTAHDPAWASKLTEPVEIRGFCDMSESHITHLSPFLHFKGLDGGKSAADFSHCDHLKTAEGNFYGLVTFQLSGIEKIGELIVHQPDTLGAAADFSRCHNLKIAEGQFNGYVTFSRSGIEKIEELHIGKANPAHHAACFTECKNLKIAEGKYPGFVSFARSGVTKIGKLTSSHINDSNHNFDFSGCMLALPKELLGPNTKTDENLRAHSMLILKQQEHAKKLIKAQPEIEI